MTRKQLHQEKVTLFTAKTDQKEFKQTGEKLNIVMAKHTYFKGQFP